MMDLMKRDNMAEIEVGNLFEMNKQIRRKSEPMETEKISESIVNVAGWCSFRCNSRYYMLLCKERSDYTIFRLNNFNYAQVGQELREVLESRGEIIGIDYMHGYDCYECWVRNEEGEPFLYMFFTCDDFIVEVG